VEGGPTFGCAYADAVLTADFHYDLPEAAIAQVPLAQRDQSRLMVDVAGSGRLQHRTVTDLPTLLSDGDLLVVNNTRVLPARLNLRKATGGAAEVLLVAPLDDSCRRWRAMVRPGRRLPDGVELLLAEPESGGGSPPRVSPGPGRFALVVGAHLSGGHREVEILCDGDPMETLYRVGEVPLPPYIHAAVADPERYQTVFAERPASVAAPTAGLHLTESVLKRCADAGVTIAAVELDIGPGTFVPVTAEAIEDHVMHSEHYRVPSDTAELCRSTAASGGSVVAVGTTVVRTLETWAATGVSEGDTALFITPGYAFAVVDRLLTNFHQPRSTLLVLLEAFVGPRWRDMYDCALTEGYRFLSFGDAMLVDRGMPGSGHFP
jgi:S-adenosylmethionine:tRNA ribosyltransferase-isomerase